MERVSKTTITGLGSRGRWHALPNARGEPRAFGFHRKKQVGMKLT